MKARRRGARLAALREATLDPRSERLRLHLDIDGFDHTVHALFHEWPALDADAWQACTEILALACLVDASTASLARRASLGALDAGALGRKVFVEAAEALRLELLACRRLPLWDRSVQLDPGGGARRWRPAKAPSEDRVLLLMGGGKDSLYAYSLLTRAGYDVRCFYLTEPRRTWQQLRRVHATLGAHTRQHRAFLDAGRLGPIDRRFRTGYFSQFQIGEVVAAALPYALATGCRFVALGIERGSDVPTFRYRGRAVNHQHQKSASFLRLLNRYLAWRLGGAVEIVSPLHGLWDTGIYARLLFAARELAPMQSSCGAANGRSPHCGQCSKCAFLAALFAGLGPPDGRRLYERLFPRDPLENLGLFEEAWLGSRRPLGCVGLVAEVEAALDAAAERSWPGRVVEAWAARPRRARPRMETFFAARRSPVLPPTMEARLSPILVQDGAQAHAGRRAYFER